jgi:hypothetical protein
MWRIRVNIQSRIAWPRLGGQMSRSDGKVWLGGLRRETVAKPLDRA